MSVALLVLIGGAVGIGVVLGARYLDARTWRSRLIAYRLRLPGDLSADAVVQWLANISAATHPPRWSLLPLPPVVIEVVATRAGIAHYLLTARDSDGQILAGLRAAVPGVRIEPAPGYLTIQPPFRAAAEVAMTSHVRPLATERVEGTSSALLAALQPLPPAAEIRLQFIATSAGTPAPVSSAESGDDDRHWLSVLVSGKASGDDEAVRAARQKIRDPLLRTVLRIGVAAPTSAEAYKLFGRVWGMAVHSLNAPGVRLVRRWLPVPEVSRRMVLRSLPLTRWPLLLGTREAAGLTGLPMAGVRLPGLGLGGARQLPPSPGMATHGAVIGMSNYPGMSARPLAVRTDDRTRHSYIVGPTGSGKSWLLARLMLQDITSGYGMSGFDPKGDLITDVLARLDEHAAERVIVLDASKRDHPVGINILGSAYSEEGRELVVDNVLHIFKEIWANFWGPRTDQILRAALLTLTSTRASDGSAFTLCEIVPLLTNAAFRRYVTTQPSVPESVRVCWQMFNAWSDGERLNAIGSVLNKVEAFTGRTPIRLALGQSQGIDLRDIFRQRKVLLVSLAKGTLGTETANLLGSLLVSSLWQATLERIRVPAERRRPVFAYIDEAQDIVRLPLAIADMLAQARGLKLGLTLANQYVAQLPEPVKRAVLGTVRTQIAFQVEYDDAKLLEARFAPLTVADLTGLERYEIAMRPCVGGQTLEPVTGLTLPLGPAVTNAQELGAASRQRYGTPRSDVEAALRARLQTGTGSSGFGRARRP
jgi:hypothetical protein